MSTLIRIVQIAVLLFGAALANPAYSQAFPNKPLRVIVPYSPGGATDAVVRALSNAVAASVGQPVIVDNRPGGNTFIGMNACAKAAPDGYTVCAVNADALSTGPFVFTKMPYEPAKDLIGITSLAAPTSGIFINGQLPFDDFKGMTAYARSNPSKLNFASFGVGTIADLYVKSFKRELKAEMTSVPYKGAGPIIQALLTNECQVAFLALGQVLTYMKEGKIKAVGIHGSRRASEAPDVPTLTELGVDLGVESYFGLYAPAKTPRQTIARLNSAFVGALRDRKVQEILAGLSMQPVGNTVEDINRSKNSELEAARSLFKLLGIKPVDAPE